MQQGTPFDMQALAAAIVASQMAARATPTAPLDPNTITAAAVAAIAKASRRATSVADEFIKAGKKVLRRLQDIEGTETVEQLA